MSDLLPFTVRQYPNAPRVPGFDFAGVRLSGRKEVEVLRVECYIAGGPHVLTVPVVVKWGNVRYGMPDDITSRCT